MAKGTTAATETAEIKNEGAGVTQAENAVANAAEAAETEGATKPENKVFLIRTPIERKGGGFVLNKDGNEMYNYTVHYESKAGKFRVEMTPPKELDNYDKSDRPKKIVNASLYRFLNLIYYDTDKAQLTRKKDDLSKRYNYIACNPDPEIPSLMIECPMIPVKDSDRAVLDFIFQRISYLP